MKMVSIIVVSLLSSALCIQSPVFAETAKSKLITDIHGFWAEATLDQWLDSGWLHGYDDKTVRPDQPVSRGEFISLINRSFQFTQTTPITFNDLKQDEWEYEEAQKAVKAGYITGYPDHTVHVHEPVSRQEAAIIIARLLGINAASTVGKIDLLDTGSLPSWSKNAIRAVTEKGIMEGYDDHMFRPTQSITRAEAVVALDMALKARQ
ncbi:S-layer homology domain-containing protein [Paenibacillus sp. GCM10027628]|uniref:S-layer homology domain-containing protein n=1 Tax=Paenibacillus sp. GCM10027628 TaxID=3273413 RepID=UPI003641EDA4